MSAQPSFFDPDFEPPSVVDTPPVGIWTAESLDAGEKAKSFRGAQHQRILDVLLDDSPLTDEQIAAAAEIGPNSIRPRLGELAEAGLIRIYDRDGRTAAGGKARRWMAT